MRACSDTIAQLAGALAKAQTGLVNPPKSLTATLERDRSGREGASYRYAPLSAGLDIIRKVLGQHELAVIQTTHIDRDSATVLLTTTLAHGSGEWIAATWPVCRTTDMSHPKLMGAALTYARRYGLFTLVGLAGEDDLDAPDQATAADPPRGSGAADGSHMSDLPGSSVNVISLAGSDDPDRFAGKSPRRRARRQPEQRPDQVPELRPEPEPASPVARGEADQPSSRVMADSPVRTTADPLGALAQIDTSEGLFRWALEVLPIRNRVPESTRAVLDAAFLARAEALGTEPDLLAAFAPRPDEGGPADPDGEAPRSSRPVSA